MQDRSSTSQTSGLPNELPAAAHEALSLPGGEVVLLPSLAERLFLPLSLARLTPPWWLRALMARRRLGDKSIPLLKGLEQRFQLTLGETERKVSPSRWVDRSVEEIHSRRPVVPGVATASLPLAELPEPMLPTLEAPIPAPVSVHSVLVQREVVERGGVEAVMAQRVATDRGVTQRDVTERGMAQRIAAPNATTFEGNAPAIQAPPMPVKVMQAPVMQAPVMQAPVMQAPVMQAPAMQAPVMQAPVMQAPVMQAPVMQAPVMQAPVMQAPVIQAPAIQAHAVSIPAPGSKATHVQGVEKTSNLNALMPEAFLRPGQTHGEGAAPVSAATASRRARGPSWPAFSEQAVRPVSSSSLASEPVTGALGPEPVVSAQPFSARIGAEVMASLLLTGDNDTKKQAGIGQPAVQNSVLKSDMPIQSAKNSPAYAQARHAPDAREATGRGPSQPALAATSSRFVEAGQPAVRRPVVGLAAPSSRPGAQSPSNTPPLALSLPMGMSMTPSAPATPSSGALGGMQPIAMGPPQPLNPVGPTAPTTPSIGTGPVTVFPPPSPSVDLDRVTEEVQRRILDHLSRERERGAGFT